MQLISVPIVGFTPPRWTPAFAAPRVMNPHLGQTTPMTTTTGKLAFIDSPFVALISDVAAASALASLGYVFYKGKSAWSNFFFAAAAAAAVKAIVDIQRLQ